AAPICGASSGRFTVFCGGSWPMETDHIARQKPVSTGVRSMTPSAASRQMSLNLSSAACSDCASHLSRATENCCAEARAVPGMSGGPRLELGAVVDGGIPDAARQHRGDKLPRLPAGLLDDVAGLRVQRDQRALLLD